jgi:thiopeptide-type bacteriocin biosynthesis protein
MAGGHCRQFSFDTYDREIERYGGPAGMEVAEAVFAADSRLVATVVQLLQDRVLLLDRTTVAVLSVDDLLAGLGLAAPERLRWYQEVVNARDQASTEYRQRKALLRALLGDPARLPSEPGGTALSAALAARRAALAPFGPRLAALAEQGVLTETPAMLYRSYVHLHCNRLLGLSAGGEQTVLGLLLRTHEGLERAPHRG